MSKPFEDNIYLGLQDGDRIKKALEGLDGSAHLALEFDRGGSEAADFAGMLAMRLEKEPSLFFPLDLRMATGPEHLVQMVSRTLISSFSGDLGKIKSVVKKLIPAATPKVVMGEIPHIDIELGADLNRIFSNLMDVPEMMGVEGNKRVVVMWKGFDMLGSVMGEVGLRTFTAKAAKHTVTSHIIIGASVAKAARDMGAAAQRPVHTIHSAELLSDAELKTYVCNGFAKAGIGLPDDMLESIFNACDGQAGLMKKLSLSAIRLWEKSAPDGMVEAALEDVLQNSGEAYRAIWRLLNSRQKSVLYGLCGKDVKNIYAEKFIRLHGFHTATNLQAALRALDRKGLLAKSGKRWGFTDPLFRHWICRESGIGVQSAL